MSDSDDQSTMKKCVLCGQTGHTSAECKNGKVGSFKLFGVKIDPTADVYQSKDVECIQVSTSNREAKSMDELKIHNNIEDNSCIDVIDEHDNDKKKGIPWTEDEHRLFLDGLEKLGKGQWRSISKHYVPTRTPTQVASHAQKYFIRMSSLEEKRKRRSSLFDMQSMTLSLRPPAPPPLPMARTYGVECYNRLPDVVKRTSQMDHQNNGIPMVNCLFQENVHPLDRWAENFAASVSKEPLPLTNEEKWSTQEPQDEKPKD